jgi:hypothetical protein
MPSSYQVVLWKQESFVVLRPLQIEFFRNLLERFAKGLEGVLMKQGLSGLFVGLSVLGAATKSGVPGSQVDHLAKAICHIAPGIRANEVQELSYTTLLEIDPELSGYVSGVSVLRDANNPGVTVQTPGVAAQLPEDGSWIAQGIELKVKKYGGPKFVKNVVLVIGVEALVDNQQIEAFVASNPPETLPFAEIWINGVEGTVRLK